MAPNTVDVSPADSVLAARFRSDEFGFSRFNGSWIENLADFFAVGYIQNIRSRRALSSLTQYPELSASGNVTGVHGQWVGPPRSSA